MPHTSAADPYVHAAYCLIFARLRSHLLSESGPHRPYHRRASVIFALSVGQHQLLLELRYAPHQCADLSETAPFFVAKTMFTWRWDAHHLRLFSLLLARERLQQVRTWYQVPGACVLGTISNIVPGKYRRSAQPKLPRSTPIQKPVGLFNR